MTFVNSIRQPTTDSRSLAIMATIHRTHCRARSSGFSRQMKRNGVADFTRNSDMLSNRTELRWTLMDLNGPSKLAMHDVEQEDAYALRQERKSRQEARQK
jgi:hypothetical protein